MKHIALITPSISSLNLGDQVVHCYIEKIISEIFTDAFLINLPAYNSFDERSKYIMDKCDLAFFCGTAPLRNSLAEHWVFENGDYDNKVILLGCGWNRDEPDQIHYETKLKYNSALSIKYVHSVRDDYTVDKLSTVQIKTSNTSCPTMWSLPSIAIQSFKSENVLLTLNSVRGNYYNDRMLCETICKNYKTIYFLPQSPFDGDYIKSMNIPFNKLAPTMSNFNKFISNSTFDYIGHRLHGGVHCLNSGKRSFIIGIDNRATEISRKTGLPVLEYGNLELLEEKINSTDEISIEQPSEKINEWKLQF